MNEMIRKRNEQLAKTVIKGLQSRNMSGYYAEDKEAAIRLAIKRVDQAAAKGILHKNTAARRKSALAKKLNAANVQ